MNPPDLSASKLLDLSITAESSDHRYAFNDGLLYWFDGRSVVALRGWPVPGAWRRLPRSDVWQPFWPRRFDISRVRMSALRAFEAFVQPMPERLLPAMEQFSSRHWNILFLAARCNAMIELIESHPALAYALASHWVFRRGSLDQPLETLHALSRQPRREIAGWLGFPATESTVKMLRKVGVGPLSVPMLLSLRQVLRGGGRLLQVFRHVKEIDVSLLRLIQRDPIRRMVDENFLFEFARYADGGTREFIFDLLCAVHAMAKQTGTTVRPLRSVMQIEAAFRQLHACTEKLDRRTERLAHNIGGGLLRDFPPPPVPGGPGIHPIVTFRDLLREGREQANCVGRLAAGVAKGDFYYYRVTEPERATLALHRPRRDVRWEIADLKAYANAHVAPATAGAVQRWFAAARDAVKSLEALRPC